MGARGNSGIILSQIVRGAVEALVLETELDGGSVARALRAASDAAYAAVSVPVEGTILTVIGEMARGAGAGGRPRPGRRARRPRSTPASGRSRARPSSCRACARPGSSMRAAPDSSSSLRGLLAGVRGEAPPAPPELDAPAPAAVLDALHHELSSYRYCTSFLVEGGELDRAALEAALGGVRRQHPRRRRRAGLQGARAHRRPGRRAPRRHRAPA